jgi:hypothetical protein
MKKSKAYRATDVKDVDVGRIGQGHPGQPLTLGLDIGKYRVLAVARWPDAQFERLWLVDHPAQLPDVLSLLRQLGQDHALTVALEPSGTYGDPVKQALTDAGLTVQRVSPKAAHDYAEVFDGVPSQHDGKDAAVVAELAALGKGTGTISDRNCACPFDFPCWGWCRRCLGYFLMLTRNRIPVPSNGVSGRRLIRVAVAPSR